MTNKNIVFFSSIYPSETTINKELEILSKSFKTVYYIPKHLKQPLPDKHKDFENIRFINLNSFKKENRKGLIIKNIPTILYLVFFYGNSFKEKIQFFIHIKIFLSILLDDLALSEKLKNFISEKHLEHAIFYDYWFENATTALCILKRKKIVYNIVSRTHGFDLYDSRWGQNMHVPYRWFKIRYINKVFAISNEGFHYLKTKTKAKYHNKISISYVGIDTETYQINDSTPKDEYILVSASHTKEFKRVHLIPDLLSNINIKIRWIHFGTGEKDELILEKIKNVPSNVKVELKGQVNNDKILDFYSKNYVNGFISLSETEGLPVSMMECACFGIPIFACNVGGISDIVNEENGLLIKHYESLSEMQVHFNIFINKNYDRLKISEDCKNKFNYKTNYTHLYNQF